MDLLVPCVLGSCGHYFVLLLRPFCPRRTGCGRGSCEVFSFVALAWALPPLMPSRPSWCGLFRVEVSFFVPAAACVLCLVFRTFCVLFLAFIQVLDWAGLPSMCSVLLVVWAGLLVGHLLDDTPPIFFFPSLFPCRQLGLHSAV